MKKTLEKKTNSQTATVFFFSPNPPMNAICSYLACFSPLLVNPRKKRHFCLSPVECQAGYWWSGLTSCAYVSLQTCRAASDVAELGGSGLKDYCRGVKEAINRRLGNTAIYSGTSRTCGVFSEDDPVFVNLCRVGRGREMEKLLCLC